MAYLLSNLDLTDDVISYVRDVALIYFSLDKYDIPNLDIGISTYQEAHSSSVIRDLVEMDVNGFITFMSNEGIRLTKSKIAITGSEINVEILYNKDSILIKL